MCHHKYCLRQFGTFLSLAVPLALLLSLFLGATWAGPALGLGASRVEPSKILSGSSRLLRRLAAFPLAPVSTRNPGAPAAATSEILAVNLSSSRQAKFAFEHLDKVGRELFPGQWRVGQEADLEGKLLPPAVIVLASEGEVLSNRSLLKAIGIKKLEVPKEPESYQRLVAVSGPVAWILVAGRDTTGTMYGGLDLAAELDLIKNGPAPQSGGGAAVGLQAVKPRTHTPSLRLRGINIFLSVQAFEDPNSWYYSKDYWQTYIDMLALDRFNFLDIHASYHLYATLFPNVFPYFVKSDKYPNVKPDIRTWPTKSISLEQARKNLEMFNTVIRMASDRGIKVGLMNYSTHVVESPDSGGQRQQLTGTKLEEYTIECVRKLLQSAPGLWVFGFRVGEGGQPADFYRRTYFKGIAESGREINLYARTWAVKSEELLALTKQHPGAQFFLEPKYNGEQLGLPYQAILGGPGGSYSYESYTNYPRSYKLIWQVRANGTHRVVHWGDAEFARRMARSCLFGEGEGFTLESMQSYYPQDDYIHNAKIKHPFYRWMFERDWFYYMTFGLAGYDLDVPDAVFIRAFERRMGRNAGRIVYDGAAAAAKIVPTIYSYHRLGFDHRDMAPELENGNGMWGDDEWTPGNHWIAFGDIDTFIPVYPLDRSSMAAIPQYVDEFLGNKPSGRRGPLQVVKSLRNAADTSTKLFDQASSLVSEPGAQEFACWKMDAEALALLARYYQKKIEAATDLQFYYKTKYVPLLCRAILRSEQATKEWQQLTEVTHQHFGWFFDRLRMRDEHYSWDIDLKRLSADAHRLGQIVREMKLGGSRSNAEPEMPSLPVSRSRSGRATRIHAMSPGSSPRLYYRKLGEDGFQSVSMTPEPITQVVPEWDSRPFPLPALVVGEIPTEKVTTGIIQYFFGAVVGNSSSSSFFFRTNERQPFQIIVSDDEQPPEVVNVASNPDRRAGKVAISLKASDVSGLDKVVLWHKATPSFKPWQAVEMPAARGEAQETGGSKADSAAPADSQQFEATIPLTSEGILYYFQVSDKVGNAAIYPDFLKRTP